jgi:hypothetical protein
MLESTQSFIDAEAAGHTWERRSPSPEDDKVLAHTWNRLNALPKGVRPVHLPVEFASHACPRLSALGRQAGRGRAIHLTLPSATRNSSNLAS